jgi:uncharacterized protein
VPPTGLLAFLAYYRAGAVDIRTGLLIIPGVVIGGFIGGKIALSLPAARMRRVFAVILFSLGAFEFFSPLVRWAAHSWR